MSESSMESYGIHLSLLDGMEEDLLLRLHNVGIATREDLESQIRTPETRRELARTLHINPDRVEAIHHLNFVFPTDQATRLFRAERNAERADGRVASVQKRLNWTIGAFALVWITTLLLGWIWMHAQSGSSTTQSVASGNGTPTTSQMTQNTKPHPEVLTTAVSASQVKQQLLDTFARMGPATGWSGPSQWSKAQHQSIASLTGPESLPKDAVIFSNALKTLIAVENHPDPAINIQARAQAAATALAAFPLPQGTSRWSVASLQVWLRLNSLSQGLASPTAVDLGKLPKVPWDWNSRGFLQAETRLARLHALPVSQKSLPEWSVSVKKLQHAVNIARDDMHPKAEAWAREIWLPKAQVELAMVGAISGAATLAPYSNLSPKAYITKRVAYIKRAYETSPKSVKSAMAWLYFESLEAQGLVTWLESHPDIRNRAQGKVWVDAIHVLDKERRLENDGPRKELDSALKEALALSGEPAQDSWASLRTAWEASMRPLLVETRAVLSRLESS